VTDLTTFTDLNLSQPILKALAQEGYETPTPIQARAIPELLAGRDLLGIAQTGTGKTAAFALPMLEFLAKKTERAARGTARALILAPTRELAAQIGDSFRVYGRNLKVSRAVVFGGVSINKQIEILRGGVDVLVATPGRLVDLIERRAVTLAKVEIFVLDEVDQMLDLGFIHAIRKLVAMLPARRQNLFFSATMPKEIANLAAGLLNDPARVEVAPVATTVERVNQSVIHVEPANKAKLLADLLRDNNMTRTLVFTRTKHGADKVMKHLSAAGFTAAAIHGNKSQANRERALAGFKQGKVLVLVATDIAARGIDVDAVSHVINYDLPFVPESYVHRIGRTARAGAEGSAVAFCTPEERPLLRDIEKTIRMAVPVKEHALAMAKVAQFAPTHGWQPLGKDKARPNGRGQQKSNRNHSGGKRSHGGGDHAKRQGGEAPQRSGSGKPSWMQEVGRRPA
jgi:ATP-dependent RNA helicase RhlE